MNDIVILSTCGGIGLISALLLLRIGIKARNKEVNEEVFERRVKKLNRRKN